MSLLCWSSPLQRSFSSFPRSWPGAALFVLRGVVGVSAMLEATFAIADAHSLLISMCAVLAALAGLALLLGFLTPIASALTAVAGTVLLVCLDAHALRLLDSSMALVEFIVMAAALAILGPGAVSVDARLFGRREVAIAEQHGPTDI